MLKKILLTTIPVAAIFTPLISLAIGLAVLIVYLGGNAIAALWSLAVFPVAILFGFSKKEINIRNILIISCIGNGLWPSIFCALLILDQGGLAKFLKGATSISPLTWGFAFFLWVITTISICIAASWLYKRDAAAN